MIKNARIFGLILIITALAIVSACQSSTTSTNANKKSATEETAKTESSPTETNNAGGKTYPLPPEIIDAELTTLDGKPFKLADYKGKVVLLNQWATWCGPCRMEIPELVKLQEEMKEKGVEVVGLTIEDDRQDAEAVKNYVEAQQIPYTIVWSSEPFWEEFGGMARFSVPASFVINREGQLTAIFVGFNPNRTPKGVRKAVEAAL